MKNYIAEFYDRNTQKVFSKSINCLNENNAMKFIEQEKKENEILIRLYVEVEI